MAYEWADTSILPYNFYNASAVVYDGKIHILGSNATSQGTKHYSWNGSTWTEESTLPYNFYGGSAVVYDGKIHILGSNATSQGEKHYSWNGSTWVEESELPYTLLGCPAVVYNGKIHVLGWYSSGHYADHYSWDGSTWTEESTLPYELPESAVVYNNKIHILGGFSNRTKHYSWDGTTWTQESTLPYAFYTSSAVVYDEKIHILGSPSFPTSHYSWNGSIWMEESTLPYQFDNGSAVVYDVRIYILGGGNTTSSRKSCYSGCKNTGVNRIIYGDQNILDLRYDSVTAGALAKDYTAHIKSGQYITGTRPKFYKNKSSRYLLVNPMRTIIDTSSDTTVFYLKGFTVAVKLRATGTNIQLVTLKTDGVTESTVNIATNVSATYQPSFTILRVRYLHANLAMIFYQYETSATAKTGITTRLVTVKNDNTLVAGGAIAITTTTSATQNVKGYFFKALYDDDIFNVRNAITIASGIYTIAAYIYYFNLATPAHTAASSASVNVSANANNYTPDLSACYTRGGFFYKNASGVPYIFLTTNYNSTARNITLENAGISGIANAKDHYVLGLSVEGFLVTYQPIYWVDDSIFYNYASLYIWSFDQTSTTNIVKLIKKIDVESLYQEAPILFKNNVLTFSNGKRYQLMINGTTSDSIYLSELEKIQSVLYGPDPGELVYPIDIGPESDIWEGVFIYGD